MDDLRSEIRAAFQEEQAAHPPLGGLRFSLTSAAATQPRPARNLQWIAVAVAALLVIAVAAGLVWTRNGPRADVPGANPAQLKDYGPPPAGVSLMYLIDPRNTSWLQAYDWQGNPRGTIKFAMPLLSRVSQSIFAAPDGSGFIYQPLGERGELLDRLGRPISTGLLPVAAIWGWADDNRHLCAVRSASPSGDWHLYTMLPGEADHPVGSIPSGQNVAPVIASCSLRNDQAILVRMTWDHQTEGPSELWTFRISDGKLLSHYNYSNPGPVEAVIASNDGLLIAENSSRSAVQPRAGAPSTIIRRVSDGSVVASLAPTVKVLAFSGDDSLVLVGNGSGYVGGVLMSLSVIDVRSGRVTWHKQLILMTGMTQPGGRDFAISSPVSDPAPTNGPFGAFEIIHGDGSVTRIPGSYTPV